MTQHGKKGGGSGWFNGGSFVPLFHEIRANTLKNNKKIEKEFDNYWDDMKKNKECMLYSCEYWK